MSEVRKCPGQECGVLPELRVSRIVNSVTSYIYECQICGWSSNHWECSKESAISSWNHSIEKGELEAEVARLKDQVKPYKDMANAMNNAMGAVGKLFTGLSNSVEISMPKNPGCVNCVFRQVDVNCVVDDEVIIADGCVLDWETEFHPIRGHETRYESCMVKNDGGQCDEFRPRLWFALSRWWYKWTKRHGEEEIRE